MSASKGIQVLNINPEEKLWGMNRIMHLNGSFQACHISIKKGGYCSNHRHERKWNQFYVVSGLLAIQSYREDKKTVETIYYIGPGQSIMVQPGVNHKFHAMEDTEAIEIYSTSVSDDDIVREDTGGMS